MFLGGRGTTDFPMACNTVHVDGSELQIKRLHGMCYPPDRWFSSMLPHAPCLAWMSNVPSHISCSGCCTACGESRLRCCYTVFQLISHTVFVIFYGVTIYASVISASTHADFQPRKLTWKPMREWPWIPSGSPRPHPIAVKVQSGEVEIDLGTHHWTTIPHKTKIHKRERCELVA